jgi:hypothetical protein
VSDGTLGAEFFRHQAQVCHTLAEAAPALTPLYARLRSLAKSYEEKARVADLNSSGSQERDGGSESLNRPAAQRY